MYLLGLNVCVLHILQCLYPTDIAMNCIEGRWYLNLHPGALCMDSIHCSVSHRPFMMDQI